MDLSIKHANPNNIALDFFINLAHSKLDFPVVITSSIIKTLNFFFILKPLLNLNLPDTLSQKILSFFNILPNKNVKESIYVKKYILNKRKIEAVFDRKYVNDMIESPSHLVFLTSLVHLQKMIYIYLCYEFGFSINLTGKENLKIWPTKLNIELPKLVTDTKDVVQTIEINSLRKIDKKTYFGKCKSYINGFPSIKADAIINLLR